MKFLRRMVPLGLSLAIVALGGCRATNRPGGSSPTAAGRVKPGPRASRAPTPTASGPSTSTISFPALPSTSTTTSPEPNRSPAGPPRATSYATLAPGAQGPAVVRLQTRLRSLGYWLGPTDGQFGDSTQQAVYALQKAARISRDGVVGPQTFAAL